MNESDNTPETVSDETPVESNGPSLAELLADDQPTETVTEQDGETDESPEQVKPNSLKSLAETLEMEDADLYAIEVPMANGESRTLGELKDLVAKQDDLDLREMQFEEQRHEAEAKLLKAQQELQQFMATIPKDALQPEKLEAFRKERDEQIAAERKKTLEVIPEWKDEAARTKDIEGIVEHLSSYGFPTEYLGSIADHRTLKYIRDNFMREQRIRRALEQVKKGAPSKTATSKPGKAPKKDGRAHVPTNSRNPLADFLS